MLRLLICLSFISLNAQEWERSFTAGELNEENQYLGGSEVLQLVGHQNKLFASVGYWQDQSNIWYGGSDISLGWSQIIILKHPDSSWTVDLDLNSYYLRPEVLKEIIFKKDHEGNFLDAPDTLLITAAYSSNYIISPVVASAFVRNESSDSWDESIIYQGSLPAGEDYSIRDMELYTDQVTGIEHLLISVGTKGIFTGSYNPTISGKIEWSSEPEIGPFSIRPLGITISHGSLYFSSGNKLFRRNDGVSPTYSIVHDFSDLNTNINSAVGGIRGLTSLESEESNNSMILMWCPNSQSKGTIYRLESNEDGSFNRVFETKISLLVEEYLPGTSVNYVLGGYNDFLKIFEPSENEYVHIVGFESLIQEGNFPQWNEYYSGALYAVRNSNAEYSIKQVNESITFDDPPLVATRCYVKSPFTNEDAIYFGGFDPNGFLSTNKAWIFKKIISLIGDINNDGVLNILDALQIVNLVLSNEYEENSDLDGDNHISIFDLLYLVNLL